MYFKPPRIAGLCEKDGGILTRPVDDNEQTIRERIRAYAKQTQPLIGHYSSMDVLHHVDGNLEAQAVSAQIYVMLGKLRHEGA